MPAVILGTLLLLAVVGILLQRRYYRDAFMVDSFHIWSFLDAMHRNDWQTMWEHTNDHLRRELGKDQFRALYERKNQPKQWPKIRFECSVPYPDGRRVFYFTIRFDNGAAGFLPVLGDAEGKFLAFC